MYIKTEYYIIAVSYTHLVKMLGVPLADVFSTMKAYTGSVYVNDFNMFNRIYLSLIHILSADHAPGVPLISCSIGVATCLLYTSGSSGGFEMQLEARGEATFDNLVDATDTLMYYASKHKEPVSYTHLTSLSYCCIQSILLRCLCS